MYVCMYIYIYIYICVYMCVYIYIYIHTRRPLRREAVQLPAAEQLVGPPGHGWGCLGGPSLVVWGVPFRPRGSLFSHRTVSHMLFFPEVGNRVHHSASDQFV